MNSIYSLSRKDYIQWIEVDEVLIFHTFVSAATVNACTMAEYNRLKSMLLEMQPKELKPREENRQKDMDEKRARVDAMFKHLDENQDGRLVSDELEKVCERANLQSYSFKSQFHWEKYWKKYIFRIIIFWKVFR